MEADNEAKLGGVLRETTPDTILSNVRLPDQNGLTIARRLRATSSIPIIMLTGMGSDIDRIIGLEMGASPSESLGHDCRRFAGWLLDLTARLLTDPSGKVVTLTNAEVLLLKAFVKAPHCVLSRDQLLVRTRSYNAEVFDRTIGVLIRRLHRKIEANPHTEAHPNETWGRVRLRCRCRARLGRLCPSHGGGITTSV